LTSWMAMFFVLLDAFVFCLYLLLSSPSTSCAWLTCSYK
jgi:hypothetical protein